MNDISTLLSNINLKDLINEGLKRIEELIKEEKIDEAEIFFKQVVKLAPTSEKAQQLHMIILYVQKKYTQLIEIISNLILKEPNNADHYNNLGLCYMKMNQIDKSIEVQMKAVELNPESCIYLNNLALSLRANNRLNECVNLFKKSLEIKPTNSKTLLGLGLVYGQLKEIDRAIDCFLKVVQKKPEKIEAYVELGYSYFLLGEWNKAWPYYEYRLEHWSKTNIAAGKFIGLFAKEKRWNGIDSLEGKKIIVYCEQGIGDFIHFIRFVPRLKELGAEVYIVTQENLVSLFEGYGQIITDEKFPLYDYHCSVISLPCLLNISVEHFKNNIPYFSINDKFDMMKYKNNFKIGIVWAGNPAHPNDSVRSCYLSQFKKISNIETVKLFSLQKDVRKRTYTTISDAIIDFSEGAEDMKVVDMSEYMTDFKETAKIIQAMDLIITVDTSVLHLAGALNKETWALIPFNPDWRWTLKGDKTVWYDSVTLFRQEEPKNWNPVFAKIESKLNDHLSRIN